MIYLTFYETWLITIEYLGRYHGKYHWEDISGKISEKRYKQVMKMKVFCQKHKALIWMCLYLIVYLLVFQTLENRRTECTVYASGIDKIIPFCKYFVIPYFSWFLYVPLTVLFLDMQEDQEEGHRLNWFLVIGMTAFLIISAVYPNGIMLRPRTLSGGDVFTRMIRLLYLADTSTNVLPSIHVYNSIGVMIALWKNEKVRKSKVVTGILMLIGVSSIMSTMLIKQHSGIDVVAAMVLAAFVYPLCYGPLAEKIQKRERVFQYRYY